ncbi:MAG: hypothetical protein LC713_06505, partial [Actinobacteria bacterium]|nr:hypothetical protein [Actinomycetota bacterium]
WQEGLAALELVLVSEDGSPTESLLGIAGAALGVSAAASIAVGGAEGGGRLDSDALAALLLVDVMGALYRRAERDQVWLDPVGELDGYRARVAGLIDAVAAGDGAGERLVWIELELHAVASRAAGVAAALANGIG